MIWVYAITDRPELPVPRRRGLAQAPLEGMPYGGVLAVITRHEHAPSEPAPDALWTHERVVERLMAERAVLPMRFGSTFADDAALRAAISPRLDRLVAGLNRVRGRVELGVRVIATGDGDVATPDPPPASGRDYVLAKLAAGRRSAQLADTVDRPLSSLAVAARRQRTREPGEVLRAAYLVDNRVLAGFRAAVDRLARERPDLALLCTGPWPPYSFIDADTPTHEPVAH